MDLVMEEQMMVIKVVEATSSARATIAKSLDLISGSNNCLQFGAYFHPKDDCCERPSGVKPNAPQTSGTNPRQQQYGWGPWSTWSACSSQCGLGKKSRWRNCEGIQCGTDLQHKFENQERPCRGTNCSAFT